MNSYQQLANFTPQAANVQPMNNTARSNYFQQTPPFCSQPHQYTQQQPMYLAAPISMGMQNMPGHPGMVLIAAYQSSPPAMAAAAGAREAIRARVEYEDAKARALTEARVLYEQSRAMFN
eukprot:6214159-Pleurochrysis_carterae.AAC.2